MHSVLLVLAALVAAAHAQVDGYDDFKYFIRATVVIVPASGQSGSGTLVFEQQVSVLMSSRSPDLSPSGSQ
jgi:hypothetical protein